MTFDFVCVYCRWEGTNPTLDAHLNAYCPLCGKPAEFREVAIKRGVWPPR